MLEKRVVGILYTKEKTYPVRDGNLWFRPSEQYPEAVFEETGNNRIYGEIRELLHLYSMDDEHYDTPEWNPLGELIHPGDCVLIKPNLVMDHNRNKSGGTDCLYTQPAVVVPVIDYVLKALDGSGAVTIGDAPMQECDFDKLIDESGYGRIIAYYKEKNAPIELVDFRGLTTEKRWIVRHQTIREEAAGTVVDLKEDSEFAGFDDEHLNRLRITNYSPDRLREHHRQGKHEYYISEYALRADVIINLPKPKTHRKAGFTAAMKNMVGINVRKEYLPHHMIGSKEEAGDEYQKKSRLRKLDDRLFDKKNTLEGKGQYRAAAFAMLFAGGLKILTRKLYSDEGEGSWYGNETIGKTIADLNKVILYADKNGRIKTAVQRRILSIGDMIIAGEKEGPVMPSPKDLGILAIGSNSYAFDMAIGTMMGADISRIPQLLDAKAVGDQYRIAVDKEIEIRSNDVRIDGSKVNEVLPADKWKLEPPSGWKEVFE